MALDGQTDLEFSPQEILNRSDPEARAGNIGAPHLRERIFVIANPSGVERIYQSNIEEEATRLCDDGHPWEVCPWDATEAKVCSVDDGITNRVVGTERRPAGLNSPATRSSAGFVMREIQTGLHKPEGGIKQRLTKSADNSAPVCLPNCALICLGSRVSFDLPLAKN